jgi:hypothetical protein
VRSALVDTAASQSSAVRLSHAPGVSVKTNDGMSVGVKTLRITNGRGRQQERDIFQRATPMRFDHYFQKLVEAFKTIREQGELHGSAWRAMKKAAYAAAVDVLYVQRNHRDDLLAHLRSMGETYDHWMDANFKPLSDNREHWCDLLRAIERGMKERDFLSQSAATWLLANAPKPQASNRTARGSVPVAGRVVRLGNDGASAVDREVDTSIEHLLRENRSLRAEVQRLKAQLVEKDKELHRLKMRGGLTLRKVGS